MPIVTTDSEKLVLLDELEGITELEAAVKIISSFIEMIKDSNSFGIAIIKGIIYFYFLSFYRMFSI